MQLDDWQAWLLEEMLQVGSDGRWSAFEAAIVIPRQNGKGGVLEARQLFGLFLGGEKLAVHTAHEFKTAQEHFLRIKNLVEGCPELDAKVSRIRLGAGEQAIELKNGARLRFLARSNGSGRGLTGDTVYLDEAFALTPPVMGALLPTLSAVPNPQVIYTSSTPKYTQQVLFDLVARGRKGESGRLFYAEWGNRHGVSLHDRDAWARANPALGIRITEEFIEAELAAMETFPTEFLRERLGVLETQEVSGAIPFDLWRAAEDKQSKATEGYAALAVRDGMQSASLAFSGRRPDSLLHAEVVRSEPSTAWVVDACRNAYNDLHQPILVDPRTATAGVLDQLTSAGIPYQEVSTSDVVKACAGLQDDVANGRIRHLGQISLNTAIIKAEVRPVGEAWVFSARASSEDITPLLAVTLACYGARGVSQPASFVDLNDFWDEEE